MTAGGKTTTKRRLVTGAVVLFACLGVLVVRAFWDGRAALTAGDRSHARAETARKRGDTAGAHVAELDAVTAWRRAARWYVPGAPHVAAAYDRLAALGTAAEAADDREVAVAAWTGVRSSALATRWLTIPYEDRRIIADTHIAKLMATSPYRSAGDGQDEASREAWHLAALTRDEAPSPGWSLAAVLGFLIWVGGGFWFAARGLGEGDRLDRRQATVSFVLVVAGMALWMLALYRA